ncbi:peptidoglycan -binding protein [Gemmobacter fulvus]|uniref:Peptidoglycan-binding protein n=1 Tax=Gemmobacter fulvus TaxID=2840474 RepID=A0A975P7R6_9RHOB|nr:peptidoglycan -binding protein [Gemmobacter fulvus]MBT9247523.1 peptidoglycan -binding protein [Gemmobacter fulvus]QWK89966.1 peptidoglycan -binding protein [Gemmobacter fulvus]
MGLSRRGSGRSGDGMIWPGFVDAVTTLLMVLMFVLTIFTVMQSVLRQTITTQGSELDALTAQVSSLADALGLERSRAEGLQLEIGTLRSSLASAQAKGTAQAAEIAALGQQLTAKETALSQADARISGFEAQVASLLAERDAARGEASALEQAQTKLISEQEALQLALAKAREEVDAQSEAARLAAARAEAVEELTAKLRAENARATTELSEAEAGKLVDQAALADLRGKLEASDTELTAMTLALEEQRKRAEETLTLLAAAQGVEGQPADLLATAKALLAEQETQSTEAARRVALLNEQIAALRGQLGGLQALLDAAEMRDVAAKVQLENLGGQLNSALAQVASEQKRRAELEQAERQRLEEEAKTLQKFRSEFFGQLREVLAGREGVRIVGDRFVFSSEVLFNPGSADLAPEGRSQIAGVAATLTEVAGQIPSGIDWIIRVDGHTDDQPLSGEGEFKDNWELSQARALSVVRYMQQSLGFPPNRMAATGFGEWQPVAPGSNATARAQNRRIELKLTER